MSHERHPGSKSIDALQPVRWRSVIGQNQLKRTSLSAKGTVPVPGAPAVQRRDGCSDATDTHSRIAGQAAQRRPACRFQEEFAHSLGITVGTVNRWENGRFRPSKLAKAAILEFARRHGLAVQADPDVVQAAADGDNKPIH